MKSIYWIIGGLAILLLSLLSIQEYRRLLRKIPYTAQNLGKKWGHTTDRYAALRYMNTFFYLTGMAVTLVGIVFVLKSSIKRPAPPVQPAPVISQTKTSPSAAEILRQVNLERQFNKLKNLTADPGLTAVAEQRIKDMVDNQYYAHKNLQGKYYFELFTEQGFSTGYSCENLDIEFTLDESVYVGNWSNSTKGHRECMLNEAVTRAGYAVGVFSDPTLDNSTAKTYLVVAIHAAPPFKKIEQKTAPPQPSPQEN